jgi:hypothetical protein
VIEPSLPETIEPAYLSTLKLMARGFPPDGLHSFRYKLMKCHGGRLFFADKGGKIGGQLNHNMMECGCQQTVIASSSGELSVHSSKVEARQTSTQRPMPGR